MKLKDILSVSGQSGLFKYISQGRNGIIVESFLDKKRSFVNATAKVSTLGDIAVYTNDDEIPLGKILKIMLEKEQGKETIDPKSSNDKLKEYFSEVLPKFDKERVYVSDIKKILVWYNILLKHDLMSIITESEEEESENKDTSNDKTGKEPKTKTSKKTEDKEFSKKIVKPAKKTAKQAQKSSKQGQKPIKTTKNK